MRIKGFSYFGTGAGLPSLVRNVSSMAVDFENEWFLFDCGEGTQQRIMASPLKMTKLTHIFISHFHGDHLYGLPGLLATMQLQGVDTPLNLIGPKGLKKYVDFIFDISGSRYKREMNFTEISYTQDDGVNEIFKHKDFTITSARLKHRVPCYGYRVNLHDLEGKFDIEKAKELGVPNDVRRRDLVNGETITTDAGDLITPEMVVSPKRKNESFTYITDTSVCKNITSLASGTEYLHHECTFMDDETALAKKSGHCTLPQVIKIADECKIKQLHLAHFSPRYDQFKLDESLTEKPYRIVITRDKMNVER